MNAQLITHGLDDDLPSELGMMIDHAGSIHSFQLSANEHELHFQFPNGSRKSLMIVGASPIDMFFPSQEGTAVWVMFGDGSERVYMVDTGETFDNAKASGRSLPPVHFIH